MSASQKAPEEEQAVCVNCGMCCDGTLFLHAHLNPGERGHLPEKIEEKSYTEEGKDYFRLPCLYFSEKCTIYDRKRADICSSFRCQLLKDMAGEKITLHDALRVVSETMVMREGVRDEYTRLSGEDSAPVFRQLLAELGKIQQAASEENHLSKGYEMLIARCNILEALLIRRFRAAEDFEKMIMK